MLYCRAIVLASWVTQPKIARIISIASGVLQWQYVTYASSCIMTKASSGYRMQCTHFVCHILEGVWLLALPKADWVKVCPGSLRVCSWTVFSFIHLGCCPITCQQSSERQNLYLAKWISTAYQINFYLLQWIAQINQVIHTWKSKLSKFNFCITFKTEDCIKQYLFP